MYAQIEGNEIKLYGSIWHGDGQYIVSQISKPLSKPKENVNVHLHTDGGSVFDGNLIYNVIASAKANVTVFIDGLAASMGSIIMLAAKKIIMAENAYIMIHAPSGFERGNAKDFESTAKLLRSMEGNFTKKISNRSNLDDEQVKALMDGDNWFSADEAKDAGLVDEISDPVLEESNLEAYKDKRICAQLFQAYNRNSEDPPPTPKPKNKEEMKLTAESLKVLGLNENSSESEINAAIEAQSKKVSEMEARAAAEYKAKCEALVNGAIAQGRILAGEKAAWLADAESNFELAERMIAKLPEKKVLNSKETPHAEEDPATANWTFDDWRKKDPKGLIETKTKDPDAYAKILARK